jgi:hypothetical protein
VGVPGLKLVSKITPGPHFHGVIQGFFIVLAKVSPSNIRKRKKLLDANFFKISFFILFKNCKI